MNSPDSRNRLTRLTRSEPQPKFQYLPAAPLAHSPAGNDSYRRSLSVPGLRTGWPAAPVRGRPRTADAERRRGSVTRCQQPGRRAVTIVQALIALAVAAVSAGIGLTWLERVREDANRVTCANNLRQLVFAAHKFHDTNGTLPPYWGAYPDQDALSVKGSWFCHLLPYVGETATYGEMMADIQKTGVNWDVGPRGGGSARRYVFQIV